MIRYYLSPVIGQGLEVDPWRPVVAEYPVSWSAVANQDRGPTIGPILVAVNASPAQHAQLRADSRLWAFPVLMGPATDHGKERSKRNDTEHVLNHGIHPAIRATIVSRARSALDLDMEWIDSDKHTARDVIRAFGAKICGAPEYDPSQTWAEQPK